MLSFRTFAFAAFAASGIAVTVAGCSGERLTRPQDELPNAARVSRTDASVLSVVVTPAVDTVAVGDTSVLSATVNSEKRAVIRFLSADTTIAQVSDSGTVRGIAAGTVQVVVTARSSSLYEAKDTATVVVVPRPATVPATTDTSKSTTAVVASVSVTPTGVRLTTGQSAKLSATALDAAGATVTGRTTTWTSSSAAIATVDTTGLTRAVAAGTATITATIDGKSATSTVTVAAPTVTTVTVALNSGSLTVGQTTQALATAKDASGTVVTGRTVTWTSSNTAAATVSTSGLVTAVGAGSAAITATVDGVSGSATESVLASTTTTSTPSTTTTAPAGAIALSIVRMDGGSGSALVSNGIPLAPGTLFPGQSKMVRVFIGGVEQALYVEELAGRHADGSLRALLVEFQANVSAGSPVSASLALGQARQTTDIAKPDVSVRGIPAAAALPTDPNYLLATDLVGDGITVADAKASSTTIAQYEANFAKYADQHWAAEGADWTNDYYDRALIYYTWWARSGNPEYWRRGTLMAVNYRKNYLEVNNYFASPHWAQLEGLEKHYLLTGDEPSRTAIWKTATVLRDGFEPTLDTNWDPRIRGRTMLSYFLSWRLQSPNADWAGLVDDALTKIIGTIEMDGHVRQYTPCGIMQNNFMVGLQNDALIKVHTYYRADSRILPAVKRSVDYMWATQWNATGNGFNYMSGDCTSAGEGGMTPAPDLNNLIVSGFGWVYRQTGDATYRTHGDQAFAASVANAWLDGTKQFNEQYTDSPRYLRDRR